MWDFYLAGSEMSFVHGGLMVFQIQLAKRVETVPLTRGYLRESELAPGPEIVADAIAQQSDGDAYEPSRSQAAE
jgi:cyclopropane-fatty-acyl-phospholipid synthase